MRCVCQRNKIVYSQFGSSDTFRENATNSKQLRIAKLTNGVVIAPSDSEIHAKKICMQMYFMYYFIIFLALFISNPILQETAGVRN